MRCQLWADMKVKGFQVNKQLDYWTAKLKINMKLNINFKSNKLFVLHAWALLV